MNLMKRFILPDADAEKALAIAAVRSTARRMVRDGVSF
ncbi:hypothetical protein ARSQ2_00098 [Arsenophonus endosymbiont of Bemisia tabaci Q2]|nr:hypothetical protein ARSQ2_00098 [Arsenophonus endosymbiont of Bemisia tabaci Q2]